MAASVATPSSSPARGDLSPPAPTPPPPHSQMRPEQDFYLGLSRGNNTDSQSVAAVGERGGRPESETGRLDRVGSDEEEEEEEEGESGPSSARADTGSVATNATVVAKPGNLLSIAAISAATDCNKVNLDVLCIARNCTSCT